MDYSGFLSIFAIVFSIINSILTLSLWFYFTRETIRFQKGLFLMERNQYFEGKLNEIPEGLDLHGIDQDEIRVDGVSSSHIAYLVSSINGMIAYGVSRNITIDEHLNKSPYRQNMFSQTITRKTWKYAKKFFDSDDVSQVNKYLKKNYPDEYSDTTI